MQKETTAQNHFALCFVALMLLSSTASGETLSLVCDGIEEKTRYTNSGTSKTNKKTRKSLHFDSGKPDWSVLLKYCEFSERKIVCSSLPPNLTFEERLGKMLDTQTVTLTLDRTTGVIDFIHIIRNGDLGSEHFTFDGTCEKSTKKKF